MPLFKICNISLRCKKYIGLIFFRVTRKFMVNFRNVSKIPQIYGKFPKFLESFRNVLEIFQLFATVIVFMFSGLVNGPGTQLYTVKNDRDLTVKNSENATVKTC